MKVEVNSGFVSVYVPVFDIEGTQRTIDFPHTGKRLYGQPLYHWTAKPYLAEATRYARNAIKASADMKS